MSEPIYERVKALADMGDTIRIADIKSLLTAFKDLENRLRGTRNDLEVMRLSFRACTATFSAIESILGQRRGNGVVEQVKLLVEDIASPDMTMEQLRASLSTEVDPRWPEFSQ